MEPNKMKKNGFLFFLLIIIIAAWWFTRGNEREAPAEGILDVWATWGDEADGLQAFFDGYSRAGGDPVTVTTRVRSDDLLEALTGTNPPDLVILSNADLVRTYHQQAVIAPLSDAIEAADIDLTGIYPALLEQCRTAGDDYLCLPWGGDMDALFWNKDLFTAAGLDPERPPQTMEEVVDFAGRLTRHNQAGELAQVGFIPDFPRSQIALYARLFGTSLSEGIRSNSQPLIDTLNWQRQFYGTDGPDGLDQFVASLTPYHSSTHTRYGGRTLSCHQCHRATPTYDKKLPDLAFFDGHLAMMLSGQWLLNPANAAGRPRVDYGVAPFPPSGTLPSRANSSVAQGPVLIIPAWAADREALAPLLGWMMTPEQLADAAYANAFLPAGPVSAQDVRFQKIAGLNVFLDLLSDPNATTMATLPDTPALNQALAELEKAVLHDGAPASALVEEFQRAFAPRLQEAVGYDNGR